MLIKLMKRRDTNEHEKSFGFFEEVKEENLRYANKIPRSTIIPAVSAVIITTAIQLLSITGIMDAFHVVMAFFIGVFAGIYVYNSRYIDDVAEVRRDIPMGEIDILLKNDTFYSKALDIVRG
ncbi:hypothetical protein DRN97_07855 [Methanosarcinales archaeon]|nr:MAG: hypothetical protein DRN97_07855 [Methanosarcinales archaeon]